MIATGDFDSFKDFIENKVETMTAILEAFKSDLAAEGVSRYKLGQDLERTKQDATKTKGRLGALELRTKEVSVDLKNLTDSLPQNDQSSGPNGPSDAVKAALTRLDDLSAEFKCQADVLEKLQAKLGGAPHMKSKQTEVIVADRAEPISDDHTDTKADELVRATQVLRCCSHQC